MAVSGGNWAGVKQRKSLTRLSFDAEVLALCRLKPLFVGQTYAGFRLRQADWERSGEVSCPC